MEWMILPFKRYADFQGRSRRKEYWMFALGLFILYVIFIAMLFAAIGTAALAGSGGGAESNALVAMFAGAGVVGIIFGLFILAVIIPSLAVGVRRLHDIDRSGWWIIAPTGINLAGLIFVGTGIDLIFSFLGLVASVVLLVFLCIEGTRGPNRFGPDPKNPEANLGDVFS